MSEKSHTRGFGLVQLSATVTTLGIAVADFAGDGVVEPVLVAACAFLGLGSVGFGIDQHLDGGKRAKIEALDLTHPDIDLHKDLPAIEKAYFEGRIDDIQYEAALDERILGLENPWKAEVDAKIWPPTPNPTPDERNEARQRRIDKLRRSIEPSADTPSRSSSIRCIARGENAPNWAHKRGLLRKRTEEGAKKLAFPPHSSDMILCSNCTESYSRLEHGNFLIPGMTHRVCPWCYDEWLNDYGFGKDLRQYSTPEGKTLPFDRAHRAIQEQIAAAVGIPPHMLGERVIIESEPIQNDMIFTTDQGYGNVVMAYSGEKVGTAQTLNVLERDDGRWIVERKIEKVYPGGHVNQIGVQFYDATHILDRWKDERTVREHAKELAKKIMQDGYKLSAEIGASIGKPIEDSLNATFTFASGALDRIKK